MTITDLLPFWWAHRPALAIYLHTKNSWSSIDVGGVMKSFCFFVVFQISSFVKFDSVRVHFFVLFKWVIGKLCLWERFARGQPADFEVLMTTAMKCDSIRRGRPQIQVKGVINLAKFRWPIRARIKTMRFKCWWTSVLRAGSSRKIWTFWVTDKESARSLNPIKDPYCQRKFFAQYS